MNTPTGMIVRVKQLLVGAPPPTAKHKSNTHTYEINAIAKFHNFIRTV